MTHPISKLPASTVKKIVVWAITLAPGIAYGANWLQTREARRDRAVTKVEERQTKLENAMASLVQTVEGHTKATEDNTAEMKELRKLLAQLALRQK